MNKITKIIIFLVTAFVIVIIITFVSNKSGTTSTSLTSSTTPTTTTSPVTDTDAYTLADIAKHSTKADCWTTINGAVYNLTPFIPSHPGGDRITVVCGKDGTAAFEAQHDSQRDPNMELAKLKIGTLEK